MHLVILLYRHHASMIPMAIVIVVVQLAIVKCINEYRQIRKECLDVLCATYE